MYWLESFFPMVVYYFAYVSFKVHRAFNAQLHNVFYCYSHQPLFFFFFLQSSKLVFHQQTFTPLGDCLLSRQTEFHF